jgi:hypothetical protein
MAARYLAHAAHLVELDRRTGRRVALSIEPEPCCFLETIGETIAFFEGHLLSEEAATWLAGRVGVSPQEARDLVRRHMGVCYDVCHAAVEFESPRESIEALDRAGIAITKLQLSSALRLPHADSEAERLLRPFDVGVYLHQVVEQRDGHLRRFPDLPQALETVRSDSAGAEWRIHCHVPVFLGDLGELGTTQAFLAEILELCRERRISDHLEVETYTWDVLPEAYRGEDKATSIARELNWTLKQLRA